MKHKYEFIVQGNVVDRITCDTQEELIKCMQILEKYQQKHFGDLK